MIDVLTDDLIDFREVAKLPPFRKGGKPAHVSTIFRLVQRGGRATNGDRVRLEAIKTPTGLRTSREAVRQFIAALTDPAGTSAPAGPTARRQTAIATAERELADAGIC